MSKKNKKTMMMIDPPSGWQYGFPKPIPKDRMKDVTTWLIEQGYPEIFIKQFGDHFYCRYWEEPDNTETNDTETESK